MLIEVYSKPGCYQCVATIRELEKLRRDHDEIRIAKLDVRDAPCLRRIEDLGYSSLPVVFVNGDDRFPDDHWAGHRPDRVARIVDRIKVAA